MEKTAAAKKLCVNVCAFYKPGKNEELACRGYVVVERLLAEGKALVLDRSGSGWDRTSTAFLIGKVCSQCDFRIDGCDFIAGLPSPPCGGFLLLAQHLSAGVLGTRDI